MRNLRNIKEFSVTAILIFLSVKKRDLLFLGWGVLYAYILMDDMFRIHEQAGIWIGTFLPKSLFPILQAKDIGEALFSVLAVGFCALLILIAYWFSKPVNRRAIGPLFYLLFGLIFLAGVVDLFQSDLTTPNLWGPLALLEEGGEMIVMSVTTWFAFRLTQL